MQKARTNKPVGSTYNRIVGAWPRTNGFDGISTQERYRAILWVEHRDEIEVWRAGLDGRGGTPRGRPARAPRLNIVKSDKGRGADGKYIRIVTWPGDFIKRAATAMRESRSNDYFVLARTALEAAIRGEHDLEELLRLKAKAAEAAVFTSPQTAARGSMILRQLYASSGKPWRSKTHGRPLGSKPASSTCIASPLMLLTIRERMPDGSVELP
jgi:hypothetical protein